MNSQAFRLPSPRPWYWRVYAVWRRYQRVYVKFLVANTLPPFLEPLMFLLAFGVGLAGYVGTVGGMSYAAFLAPGMIASTVMYTSSFDTTYGTFVRMEYERIYEAILASPTSFGEMLLGEVFWISFKCAVFSLVVLGVVAAFGLVPSWWALLVAPVGLLGGVIFSLMGIIVTSQVREMNNFNFYLTGVVTPMFFLSGVVFPLSELPALLRGFCQVLPMTHLVVLMRSCCTGRIGIETLLSGLVCALWCAALWPPAYVLLRRRIVI